METKENCPCRKKKSEFHGICEECRKYHANSKRKRTVTCERKKFSLKNLFFK